MTELIEILADDEITQELIVGLNDLKIITVLVTLFKMLVFLKLICLYREIW